MKIVVPAVFVGVALGIAGTWYFLQPSEVSPGARTPQNASTSAAKAVKSETELPPAPVVNQAPEAKSGEAEKVQPEKKTEEAEEEDVEEVLAKMVGGQIKNQAKSKLERLTSLLSLTPGQRSSLLAFLDQQQKAKEIQKRKIQESPLMRKFYSRAPMTEAERKELEQLETDHKPPVTQEWAKENLTPEQASRYEAYQLEQKTSLAETQGAHEIYKINSIVKLTEAQKDELFKFHSDKTIKAPYLDETDATPPGISSLAQIAADQARERDALQKILTPEQFEIYSARMEERRKAEEQLYKSMGLPSPAGKTP